MHDGIGHMVPPWADPPGKHPPQADTPLEAHTHTHPEKHAPQEQESFNLTAETHFLHVFFKYLHRLMSLNVLLS